MVPTGSLGSLGFEPGTFWLGVKPSDSCTIQLGSDGLIPPTVAPVLYALHYGTRIQVVLEEDFGTFRGRLRPQHTRSILDQLKL